MGDTFKKAVKSKAKLRGALFGPSGAGKTFSALAIASGMGSKIALIDSERGSASKYADRFSFDVVDLEVKTVEEYTAMIAAAGEAGYEVLIIDSLSHAWQQLQEDVEKIAKARYQGNYWSAWSEGTPMQRRLVDAILNFPGHVIATMRSKTEWETVKDERTGKSKPQRIGLAPEQGKGIEYEFDILFEINTDHLASVIKDRTGKFQDKLIEKPGQKFGAELIAWLSEGAPAAPRGSLQSSLPPADRQGSPSAGAGDAGGGAGVKKNLRDTLKPELVPIFDRMVALKGEIGEIILAMNGETAVFSEQDRTLARDEVRGVMKVSLEAENALAQILRRWKGIYDERIANTPKPELGALSPAAQAVAKAAGLTFEDDIPGDAVPETAEETAELFS
jgi:hypothetical protein